MMWMPSHRWRTAPLTLVFVVCLTTACTQTLPVSGLKPIFPPAETGWPSVSSLQPTLRWKALLPNEKDSSSNSIHDGISHVRYELRIWREKHGRPVELVYERQDLEDNVHKLAHPLLPASNYFWTVRARFDLEGKRRVSPWSRIGPRQKTGVIKIPSSAYLRLETPSDDHKAPDNDGPP